MPNSSGRAEGQRAILLLVGPGYREEKHRRLDERLKKAGSR
jgi:hypothetical protein